MFIALKRALEEEEWEDVEISCGSPVYCTGDC